MDGVGLFGSQFPPGFRFHPTDQELIIHYMRSKITSTNTMVTSIIADVDIYKFNPWDLPDKAFFGEGEWFFFSPRDRKYPNGARPNRAAASGYWKATGTDKPILAIGGSQCLGVKKALVFYQGRPPKGNKTDWVMHEYRLLDAPNPPTSNFSKHKAANSMRLDDWVLCRVRKKVSTPTQSEEEGGGGVLAESSSGLTYPPINPNLIIDQRRQQQQQITPKELSSGNNNIYMSNYEEHQPAAFTADTIIDYQEDQKGGESCTSYNSNLDFTKSSDVSNMSFVIDQMQQQQQQQQLVSPMLLGSLKRTFSFGGALDELMFQTPNKRLAYSVDHDDEQLSRGLSVYVDQSFPDFF